MRTYYLDSSAALKLIVNEAESLALRTWLADERPRLVACDVVRTEVLRACRRHSPESIARSRTVLDSLTFIPVSTELCMSAATLDPHGLRTLDAIHLAAGLSLGDDASGVLTYDDRLAAACNGYGLPVIAPA